MSRKCSLAKLLTLLVVASVAFQVANSALAANGTWVTDTSAVYPSWTNAADWSGSVIPGSATNPGATVNGDIALFGTKISSGTPNVNSSVSPVNYLGSLEFTGNVNWPGAGTTAVPINFQGGIFSPNAATSNNAIVLFDSNYSAAAGQVFSTNGTTILNNPAGSGLSSNFSIVDNSPNGSNITLAMYTTYGNTVGMTNLIFDGTNTNSTMTTPGAGSSYIIGDGANAAGQGGAGIAGATTEITKTGIGQWTLPTMVGSNSSLRISGPINVQQGTLILNGNASYSGDVHLGGSAIDTTTTPKRVVNVAYGANLGTTNGASTNALGLYIRSTSNSGQGNIGYILQGNGTVVGSTTATYGTVTFWDSAHGMSPASSALIKPGDPINTSSAVGTLTTGNEIWADRYGIGDGYSWGFNSISGQGLQAAATNSNNWTGGSELIVKGTVDLTHLNTSDINPGRFSIDITGYNGIAASSVGGWTGLGTYSWDIADITGGFTGQAFNPSLFNLNTSAFTAAGNAITGSGFSLSEASDGSSNGEYLVLTYTGNPLVITPEPGTIAMLLSGVLALLGFAWRRKK